MSDDLPRTSRRSARLVELLILVASLAAGFGAVRGWLSLRIATNPVMGSPYPPYPTTVRDWYLAAILALFPTTLAVIPLWLGLGRSSPRRARPRMSPGVMVPFAVLIAVVIGVLGEEINYRYGLFSPGYDGSSLAMALRLMIVVNSVTDDTAISSAIVVSWMTLALAGRWVAEDAWAGRLGRFLGYAWLSGFVGFRVYIIAMLLILGRPV